MRTVPIDTEGVSMRTVPIDTRCVFTVGEAFMPPGYAVRFRRNVRKNRNVIPPGAKNGSPTVYFTAFPKQIYKHQFITLIYPSRRDSSTVHCQLSTVH